MNTLAHHTKLNIARAVVGHKDLRSAAYALGIHERTLQRKMEEYGITKEAIITVLSDWVATVEKRPLEERIQRDTQTYNNQLNHLKSVLK